jgi:hypothetical protein
MLNVSDLQLRSQIRAALVRLEYLKDRLDPEVLRPFHREASKAFEFWERSRSEETLWDRRLGSLGIYTVFRAIGEIDPSFSKGFAAELVALRYRGS